MSNIFWGCDIQYKNVIENETDIIPNRMIYITLTSLQMLRRWSKFEGKKTDVEALKACEILFGFYHQMSIKVNKGTSI